LPGFNGTTAGGVGAATRGAGFPPRPPNDEKLAAARHVLGGCVPPRSSNAFHKLGLELQSFETEIGNEKFRTAFRAKDLWCCRYSILGSGKGHKGYEDDGAHPRLARCDLFDNGELLRRTDRPQRDDEPATHFELLN
jgi:hypothetical protein